MGKRTKLIDSLNSYNIRQTELEVAQCALSGVESGELVGNRQIRRKLASYIRQAQDRVKTAESVLQRQMILAINLIQLDDRGWYVVRYADVHGSLKLAKVPLVLEEAHNLSRDSRYVDELTEEELGKASVNKELLKAYSTAITSSAKEVLDRMLAGQDSIRIPLNDPMLPSVPKSCSIEAVTVDEDGKELPVEKEVATSLGMKEAKTLEANKVEVVVEPTPPTVEEVPLEELLDDGAELVLPLPSRVPPGELILPKKPNVSEHALRRWCERVDGTRFDPSTRDKVSKVITRAMSKAVGLYSDPEGGSYFIDKSNIVYVMSATGNVLVTVYVVTYGFAPSIDRMIIEEQVKLIGECHDALVSSKELLNKRNVRASKKLGVIDDEIMLLKAQIANLEATRETITTQLVERESEVELASTKYHTEFNKVFKKRKVGVAYVR